MERMLQDLRTIAMAIIMIVILLLVIILLLLVLLSRQGIPLQVVAGRSANPCPVLLLLRC